jgi:nicotinamidase-related amidase
MLLDPSDSTLVLVDYQERLMPAIADAANVLRNAERLARLAAMFNVPEAVVTMPFGKERILHV